MRINRPTASVLPFLEREDADALVDAPHDLFDNADS